MKLINYNYGYISTFDCVIRGKIVVTPYQWGQIRKMLMRTTKWTGHHEPNWYKREVLIPDMERGIKTKEGTLYNIRTSATYEVAKQYKLKGYKSQNYMFLVLNK